MGRRPPGSSRSVLTSRSPKTVMATVRGMGVAVMTRVWGLCPALSRRASRCSTPKRCCSSTTASPRSANWTASWIRAWVPTTIPAAPLAMSSSALRRAVAPMLPVSRVTSVAFSSPPSLPGMASGPRARVIFSWCWVASTSVGASMAACPPLSTTCSMARSATTVLPEPTSPCSRRFMGAVPESSAAICSPTSRCPGVSSNGRSASKRARMPSARTGRGSTGCEACSARRRRSSACSTNASWKRKRRWADSYAATVSGRCRSR